MTADYNTNEMIYNTVDVAVEMVVDMYQIAKERNTSMDAPSMYSTLMEYDIKKKR